MLINIFLFCMGLFFLIIGADRFILYLKLLAKKLNISEFIIGLFLASFATTLPEITVSIISSIQGNSTIALGNALGSVLVNIAFILGISS
ncbi:MAG: sodium:calcium antiporter, partial [Dictyoglomaceae bacterium]